MKRLPRHFVYALWSEKLDQVYIGYTSNICRRFREHNAADNTGWTRKGMPWRLLAVQSYLDNHSALNVERHLKRGRYNKQNWLRTLPRLKALRSNS